MCYWGLKRQGDTGVFVSLLDRSKARLLWMPPTRGLFWLSHPHYLSHSSSPQLFHNIQRTGAHNLGRKHTRRSEVVQQQPWARDAYELACLWGTDGDLQEGSPPWLLMVLLSLSPGIQPWPSQRSPKEEETRWSPTHSEHRPCGSTWWPQQVSSRPCNQRKDILNLRILICILSQLLPKYFFRLFVNFCEHDLSTSVSSYDKNQAYSTEWSDDEQPTAFSGNENGGNGNSFEDDSSTGKGVRVRALYDYEGQEQDELSFKAGNDH